MDAETVAYIAGIIDGEGCIGLGRRQEIYVTPTLQVSNTNRELVEWLGQMLGGSVYEMKERRPTRKPMWLWTCAGDVARSAIRSVYPYLRVKAAQADVILGLVPEYEMRTNSAGGRSRCLTPRSLERNQEALEAIRLLNKRGI